MNTIFGLKEAGVFRGAKRKLKFAREGTDTPKKCLKFDKLADMLGTMNINMMGEGGRKFNRFQVKVKVSECVGGWHGARKSPPKGRSLKKTSTKGSSRPAPSWCQQGKTPELSLHEKSRSKRRQIRKHRLQEHRKR